MKYKKFYLFTLISLNVVAIISIVIVDHFEYDTISAHVNEIIKKPSKFGLQHNAHLEFRKALPSSINLNEKYKVSHKIHKINIKTTSEKEKTANIQLKTNDKTINVVFPDIQKNTYYSLIATNKRGERFFLIFNEKKRFTSTPPPLEVKQTP